MMQRSRSVRCQKPLTAIDMATRQTIVRVSATYGLTIKVGDEVRRGQKINEGPETDPTSRAPVAGIVKSIQFDPGGHEFVIVIARAD